MSRYEAQKNVAGDRVHRPQNDDVAANDLDHKVVDRNAPPRKRVVCYANRTNAIKIADALEDADIAERANAEEAAYSRAHPMPGRRAGEVLA